VHRHNEVGLEGLKNRTGACGARRKLTEAQEATFAGWVREGPSKDVRKVVRWRCEDLRDEIARHFRIEMHERTVGKLLARLNFSHVPVRPRHPERDVAAQEAHKKTSPVWSRQSSPSTLEASRSSSGGRMKRVSANRAA
jgi:transposase